MKNKIDYRKKMMQILDCFSSMEGTLYELHWVDYGITEEERNKIVSEFKEFLNAKDNN